MLTVKTSKELSGHFLIRKIMVKKLSVELAGKIVYLVCGIKLTIVFFPDLFFPNCFPWKILLRIAALWNRDAL